MLNYQRVSNKFLGEVQSKYFLDRADLLGMDALLGIELRVLEILQGGCPPSYKPIDNQQKP